MANEGQHSDPPELTSGDDIDKVLGQANPNPTRTGCPPREVLIALARRERPIGDPAYEHLTKCSPCYREFRALQGAQAPQRPVGAFKWVAAAAAVLVTLVGGWFFFVAQDRAVPTDQVARQESQTPELRTELDLRQYAVTRSDQTKGDRPPIPLPRGRLSVTILMPVGSEPGSYEIQVLDSELKSRASATGQAEIRNYITTLQSTIDLRSLPPGTYQLALRRRGEDWELFPARIE